MNAADEYEAYQAKLPTWTRKHWAAAELAQMQPHYDHPGLSRDEYGVIFISRKTPCPGRRKKAPGWWQTEGEAWPTEPCKNTAGYRTTHEGFGSCYRCNGHIGSRLKQGAILMALAYADELNVSPWEALMSQCRLLANQVEWLRVLVYQYEREGGVEALKPGGDGWWAVDLMEQRGDRLAKVAKSCIDAGIAKQLVEQVTLEGEAMAKAAVTALDALGLTAGQRDQFMEVMSRELLELESGLDKRAQV